MEPADTLCDALFRWLENREKCAELLEKLAQELEDQGSKIAKVVRSALSRSAVAVPVFPSLASEVLLGAASTVEGPVSISAFNKTTELFKEDEKAGTNIQKLLRDLKDRCGETLKDGCAEAPLGTHADELDCEMATQLMCALARRSNTPVPLDFLRGFNRATFFRHMTPGGLAPAEASDFICHALGLDHSPEITRSLKVSAKEMVKNIELIGIKAADAGSEGATGLGLCLYDLIVTSVELVKGDRVTEACEFLRDSARQILDGQQRLKEQLDAMQEINQKLFQMKNLIEDMGGYSLMMTENVQKIMDFIKGTCRDNKVVSWLKALPDQNEFVNLLRLCHERLSPFLENLIKPGGDHIDIVFVAHGSIVDQFMSAGGLVPAPNIRDTILYSPWNCGIDAKAAFAIAQGFIEVSNREFYNIAYWDWELNPLPDHWNSMRRSRHDIPVILLSPLTPEDEAWKRFHELMQNRGMELEDRVIIPYLVPESLVNAFGEIPLHMLIFATSCILMNHGKTATVHLAACLIRKVSYPEEWRIQYAYTREAMCMSVNLRNRNVDSELYRALSSLFDRNSR